MKHKNYAIVIGSAPYGSRHAKDALDMVLALSAFEQSILLVFEHGGIMNLSAIKAQHSHIKTFANEWAALPQYDVNNIVVVGDKTEWEDSECPLPVRVLDSETAAQEIARCDIVLRF